MKYLKILTLCLLTSYFSNDAMAQGCVAIRGGSSCNASLPLSSNFMKGQWLVGTGFRYFKSFRHFRGSEEEHHRIEEGTQVINHSYFLDMNVFYGLSERSYANLVIPFVHHDRSSMYEHGGNPPNGLGERHHTSASGLGDMRISAGYWLIDPAKHGKTNFAVELGLKLPTGKYDYEDTFYNQGEERNSDEMAVVDQSIQPGDGGLGISVGLQGFHSLSSTISLSTNLFYLFNPRETNGVLTRNGSSEFSSPDQFAARLGAYYMTPIHGFSAYLGGRVEGVPAKDIIGGSEGYRRPGYAISVEPGISFATGKFTFDLTVPVAVERNRIQNYEDIQRTKETGVYRHGDAAFADYLINVALTYRFGGKNNIPDPSEFDLNP